MIKEEEIKKIATLARIRLQGKEINKFQKEFSDILGYFDLMKELNVAKVKPTFHSSENYINEAMREDVAVAEDEKRVELIIGLFPQKEARCIKVRAILDE